MKQTRQVPLEAGWPVLLADLGVTPSHVLRRAELPADLFSRSNARLSTDEYFALWRALEAEAEDPLFPVRVGQVVSAEMFHPPIFAAMCSPNLSVAASRIQQYKRLVAPMRMGIEQDDATTCVSFEWLDATVDVPSSLAFVELVFFVQLSRIATRERIVPVRVENHELPQHPGPYEDYFGVPVEKGRHAVTFRNADMERPFLTANERTWEAFEPELRRRLAELDETATQAQRVRASLLELLPSGRSRMDEVAKTLAMSTRTLQRRLKDEGTTFQAVLDETREDLAMHYLKKTTVTNPEIAYLLGFEDSNSFYRAFQRWTGTTPETVRSTSS